MNSQTQSAVSSIAVLLGGVFSVLVMTKTITPADSSTLQNALLTLIPAAITIGGFVAKWFQHKPESIAIAASAIPGVKVEVNPMAASAAVVAAAEAPTNAVKVSAP